MRTQRTVRDWHAAYARGATRRRGVALAPAANEIPYTHYPLPFHSYLHYVAIHQTGERRGCRRQDARWTGGQGNAGARLAWKTSGSSLSPLSSPCAACIRAPWLRGAENGSLCISLNLMRREESWWWALWRDDVSGRRNGGDVTWWRMRRGRRAAHFLAQTTALPLYLLLLMPTMPSRAAPAFHSLPPRRLPGAGGRLERCTALLPAALAPPASGAAWRTNGIAELGWATRSSSRRRRQHGRTRAAAHARCDALIMARRRRGDRCGEAMAYAAR